MTNKTYDKYKAVMNNKSDSEEKLLQTLNSFEFTLSGITSFEQTHGLNYGIDLYKKWIQKGLEGDMKYLSDHLPQKENPKLLLSNLQSVICVAESYYPHPKPLQILPGLNVALYAQGEDYHFWFKEKLKNLCLKLKEIFPDETFVPFTDSAPILERTFAYHAGLGWFGKNSCLINQKNGSFFFLGEILSSLPISKASQPLEIPDLCGNCTRCIDACPTKAIIEPKVVDARKCISYLTIESKSNPDLELREKIGSCFFGCDICQTVCPWNSKILKHNLSNSQDHKKQNESLEFILLESGKKIEKTLKSTPVLRSKSYGLKRNALIVIGNLKITSLKSIVEKFIEKISPNPTKNNLLLKELAEWTLKRLCS